MLHLFLAAAIGWQSPVDRTNRVHAADVFESVAVTWSAPADVSVRIRGSVDGQQWSAWIALPIDRDSSDASAGRSVSAITHLGIAAHELEIASSAPVQRVNATFFPPHIVRRGIAPQSLSVGHLIGRSRQDWQCPEGESSPQWPPAYTIVTHAVVHHTDGANSVPDWEAEVRSIWYLHTYTNGWGDIGYNYLIDPNGVIYEGRAGGSGAIGAHFSCRNTNTVGVALLGTFTTALPTTSALNSLRQLLAELCARNHIDPKAFAYHVPSGLNMPTIIGHRDGNPSPLTCTRTECPGDALYAMLPAIRTDVAAVTLAPIPRKRAARH